MERKYLIELVKVLLKIKNQKEMIDFLQGILTPKELEEIPKRLAIVKMLKKGIPQKQIAEKLKVGIATVTRGSNEIKKGRFKNI
jgi:TrpR family trp operon transcriptional repressor